jgi:hypothetical protein
MFFDVTSGHTEQSAWEPAPATPTQQLQPDVQSVLGQLVSIAACMTLVHIGLGPVCANISLHFLWQRH